MRQRIFKPANLPHLHTGGRIRPDEQMHMVGHKHVCPYLKPVYLPRPLQFGQQKLTRSRVSQIVSLKVA